MLVLLFLITLATARTDTGTDYSNNRNIPVPNNRKTFALETPDWVLDINATVSATVGIRGKYVSFPDWEGNLWMINSKTKNIAWKVNIASAYYGSTGTILCRTTPIWYEDNKGDYLIIAINGPADVLKIRVSDGSLVSKINLDDHPVAIITQTGTLRKKYLYIGTSSNESVLAMNPLYKTYTFSGTFFRINIKTMTITHSEPSCDSPGFAGCATWGGNNPAIDEKLNMVYYGTGNNYQVPEWYNLCINNTAQEDWDSVCSSNITGNNMVDSVVARDLDDLSLIFYNKYTGYDAWNLGCGLPGFIPSNSNCPLVPGNDTDVPMGPTILKIKGRKALVTGQKSGLIHVADAADGEVICSVQAGPGGKFGGFAWGLATDGKYIYGSLINNDWGNWTLLDGTVTQCGGWVAIDPSKNCEIVWNVVNPACYSNVTGLSKTAYSFGPPLIVGNQLLVTSGDTHWFPQWSINYSTGVPTSGFGGHVHIIDLVGSTKGQITSTYETGAHVHGGFSSDGKYAYVGHGYPFDKGGSSGFKFFRWERK